MSYKVEEQRFGVFEFGIKLKRPSENTQLLRNWHNWSYILPFFRTTRTWEFNSTSPIRSMTFNMVLWGGPLYLLKLFDFVFNFITGWTIIGPYIVNVLPRMVMLALSFISDYTVYQICVLYKHSYNQCLTTLASSYVMLIYSTRTFRFN